MEIAEVSHKLLNSELALTLKEFNTIRPMSLLSDQETYNTLMQVLYSVQDIENIEEYLESTLLPLKDRCDVAFRDELNAIFQIKPEYTQTYSNMQEKLNAQGYVTIMDIIKAKQQLLLGHLNKSKNILSVIVALRDHCVEILIKKVLIVI